MLGPSITGPATVSALFDAVDGVGASSWTTVFLVVVEK